MPASPDPDLGLRLAKALVDVYAAAALHLLELVARRLARGIDDPGWAEAKLAEVARLRDDAQAVLDDLIEAGPVAVREAIEAAYERGARDAAVDVPDLPPLARPGRAVDQLVAETVSQVQSTHGGILRSVLDVYRSIVAETSSQVLVGSQTRLQAAQAALDRFAQRGITGFVDSAGRRWELETYAEMATRTAVGRAQVAGTLDRLSASGRDLVIVSDAPQECIICRPWEQKVLSITGATPGYPTVATATAAGLFHAACRHALTAFIPGLTTPTTHTADPAGDAARQRQRYLERGVRSWKRRAAASIDPQARKRAEAHARQWQARLRDHVETNDLQRRRERERIGSAR